MAMVYSKYKTRTRQTYLILLTQEAARLHRDRIPVAARVVNKRELCVSLPDVIEARRELPHHDEELGPSGVEGNGNYFFLGEAKSGDSVTEDATREDGGGGRWNGGGGGGGREAEWRRRGR